MAETAMGWASLVEDVVEADERDYQIDDVGHEQELDGLEGDAPRGEQLGGRAHEPIGRLLGARSEHAAALVDGGILGEQGE